MATNMRTLVGTIMLLNGAIIAVNLQDNILGIRHV